MRRRFLLILLTLALSIPALPQRGGESVYSFLGLTNSARAAALGGMNVSINDDDINLAFHNPALLSAGMNQHLNLNFINYFAGVNYGYSSYAFHKEGIGTFGAGIHYVNYGIFDGMDQYGNPEGTFRASDYALNLFYSRELIDSTLRVGVILKPIYSSYERYSSFGLASDLGLIYTNHRSYTSVGLVLKNMGTQITSFAGTREQLPFEIQAGITQGLAHAPFRFSIQFQHLERWDLTYEKEDDNDLVFGNEPPAESKFDVFADKFMRHAIFGVEVLFGKNFHIDVGYNYKRRQELKMDSWPGMVGFSWGFGFRISKFHLAYGHSRYHLADATNHFSLTTDLSSFYRRK